MNRDDQNFEDSIASISSLNSVYKKKRKDPKNSQLLEAAILKAQPMPELNDNSEARIEAMATQVSKTAMMRAIIIEEMPEQYKIRNFTKIYLIPESIICVYLLITLVVEVQGDTNGDVYKFYRNSIAAFVFICLIPFMALRIISLLCCRSPRLMVWQFFGIWLPNLISYALWCLIILFYFIIKEPRKDHTPFTIHYANLVLLLVSLCLSIALTFCGLPFYFNKLYQRAKDDKSELSRKIGQVRLLPKVRYNNKIHNSISFCTICMENFKNATSYITYLPCDARHYFHTKCIRSWLLSKE